VEDRIEYFERMLADNPDNPTGLLALANEYDKLGVTKTRRRSSSATWRPTTSVSVLRDNT
jgi:hypothetical protein